MKLLGLISLFLVLGCDTRNCSEKYHSKIHHVGGCDRNGRCGVMLEDKTVLSFAEYPVVGAYPQGPCFKEGQNQ